MRKIKSRWMILVLICFLTACGTEVSVSESQNAVLTIENCDELSKVLCEPQMDYMIFANKYDGCRVEFNAYVYSHITYDGGTSHIIDVAWGDNGGDKAPGYIVRIGDRTWNPAIDYSVEEGELVVVSGTIDASWSEYYKRLYIECKELTRR